MGSASNKNHVSSAVLRKKKDTATLNLNRCTGKTSRVGEKREMYRSLQRKDRDSGRLPFKVHTKKGKSNICASVLSRPYKMTP